MEPALALLHRALHGDSGAQAFLERTTSVYVMDLADSSNPKTYGCWNFIHQAMNEVERYEAKIFQVQGAQPIPDGASLVGHVRLLTATALRSARRSPAREKELIATCIANAEEYQGSQHQSQWLVDLALEQREIVMGRLAAMAFDFSFHRLTSVHGYSAFADRVVMDSLCAILAANAISSGPQSISFFALEWIVPSSKNLPSFSLASVVANLAIESQKMTVPAGTKATLQRLSAQVVALVLAPILKDAVNETSTTSVGMSSHKESARTASMCINGVRQWCLATELSLPQIKHVCGKIDVSTVVLSLSICFHFIH